MKTFSFKKARPNPELLALQAELQDAQWELTLAYRRFNHAVHQTFVHAVFRHIEIEVH